MKKALIIDMRKSLQCPVKTHYVTFSLFWQGQHSMLPLSGGQVAGIVQDKKFLNRILFIVCKK
jgi:hypothetical protein